MLSSCPRDASFRALCAANKEESTLAESLEFWNRQAAPSAKDFHLAQEICYGVQRRMLSLDYLGKLLNHPQPLKLKSKEKTILRIALYQFYFLERIPTYALVDESVRLAKRHCHVRFANFLNAILRKLEDKTLALPQGNSVEEMSTAHSYPPYFIHQLLSQYGLSQTKDILTSLNLPAQLMARKRARELSMLSFTSDQREEIAKSKEFYIQNITPATIIHSLAKESSSPQTLLDLCAAPGGKLLAAHDLFPDALLFANDISSKRLERLRSNFTKYEIDAEVTCFSAENYPEERLFDLIILDVPCSNSGVLHKRPEARWRISPESIEELSKLQMSLLQKAKRLLSPQGEIWYITCSILSQENEEIVAQAAKIGLQSAGPYLKYLPNQQGWDGGFACKLKHCP
jgi:16S rRNA (cytosine967-C5)-methyltransferase